MNQNNNDIIAGRNPVTEALKKTDCKIDTVYISGKDGSIGLIKRLALDKGIPVKNVTQEKLDGMANGVSHQGVIATIAAAEYVEVSEILSIAKNKNKQSFIIVCDGLEDPHNLGAVIRTAEAAGADGMIIPKRRSASVNQTVYKTSAGAAALLPVARVANISAAIDELKNNGVWVFGADMSGSDYTETDFTGHIALVVGSEGEGIGRLVKERCDGLVKIPMFGEINSLNASVAAGVLMYEVVRQRQALPK